MTNEAPVKVQAARLIFYMLRPYFISYIILYFTPLTHNCLLSGVVNRYQLLTSAWHIYTMARRHTFTVGRSSCCCGFQYDCLLPVVHSCCCLAHVLHLPNTGQSLQIHQLYHFISFIVSSANLSHKSLLAAAAQGSPPSLTKSPCGV